MTDQSDHAASFDAARAHLAKITADGAARMNAVRTELRRDAARLTGTGQTLRDRLLEAIGGDDLTDGTDAQLTGLVCDMLVLAMADLAKADTTEEWNVRWADGTTDPGAYTDDTGPRFAVQVNGRGEVVSRRVRTIRDAWRNA